MSQMKFYQKTLLVIPSRVWPYEDMGFAGGHVLASFNRNWVRDARFSWRVAPPFWKTPEPMTTIAVSLMRDKSKNDAEM